MKLTNGLGWAKFYRIASVFALVLCVPQILSGHPELADILIAPVAAIVLVKSTKLLPICWQAFAVLGQDPL